MRLAKKSALIPALSPRKRENHLLLRQQIQRRLCRKAGFPVTLSLGERAGVRADFLYPIAFVIRHFSLVIASCS